MVAAFWFALGLVMTFLPAFAHSMRQHRIARCSTRSRIAATTVPGGCIAIAYQYVPVGVVAQGDRKPRGTVVQLLDGQDAPAIVCAGFALCSRAGQRQAGSHAVVPLRRPAVRLPVGRAATSYKLVDVGDVKHAPDPA